MTVTQEEQRWRDGGMIDKWLDIQSPQVFVIKIRAASARTSITLT